MKFASFLMLSSLGVATALAPNPAIAQAGGSGNCVCLISESSGGSAPIGQLVSASGSVYISGANGFQLVSVGTAVPNSAQIQTGPDGAADIQMGSNCDLKIGANTTVTMTPGQDSTCVTETTVSDQGNGNGALTAGLAGGAALGVGLGLKAGLGNQAPISQ